MLSKPFIQFNTLKVFFLLLFLGGAIQDLLSTITNFKGNSSKIENSLLKGSYRCVCICISGYLGYFYY